MHSCCTIWGFASYKMSLMPNDGYLQRYYTSIGSLYATIDARLTNVLCLEEILIDCKKNIFVKLKLLFHQELKA